ncbi:MAG TPA: hypothetical protein VEB64_12005 [Azospirillaceae bacterium]|nr:hypothetical protein [Azospirillaceae bacterium]
MTEDVRLADEDYQKYSALVARTPLGQAFLDEHARRARAMPFDEVYSIVSSLKAAWNEHYQIANAARHVEVLRRELQDMSASIVQARREIASLRPKDEGNDRIMSATNELDQIVLSTERASIEIINAAERIMELNGRLRAHGAPTQICDDLDNEATNIFTACSFQDLTGQRTTKVVNALRYIEQRIQAMTTIWGIDEINPMDIAPDKQDARPDAHLLNGPTSHGIDQGEVDRLLSGLVSLAPASAASSATTSSSNPTPPSTQPPADEEGSISPMDQSDIDSLFP